MELAQQIGLFEGAEVHSHNEPRITLEHDGVTITLLGTAHVSHHSANYATAVLELCENRYRTLITPDAIGKLDLVQVFRKGHGQMLITNVDVAHYVHQK